MTRNQIVCSLNRLILTQDSSLTMAGVQQVDGKMDLSVYADVVDIRGPISLPDRSVKIFARRLCSSVDSKSQLAKIDISGLSAGGAAGREQKRAKLSPSHGGETCVTILGFHMDCEKMGGNGKTGERGNGGGNGNRGGNAWEIEITCGEPDPQLRLELIARGGCGQDGQPGQHGQDGQDGGIGAEGTKGFLGVGAKYGTRGGKAGDGGPGGAGGQGGSGGNGGSVTIAFVKGFKEEMIKVDVRAGDMGNPGAPGEGGAAGQGGKSGRNLVLSQNEGWFDLGELDPGDKGSAGKTADPTKNPANDGKTGSVARQQFNMSQLGERASLAHVNMMMQRIRWNYLAADAAENPAGFTETAELLTWISALTAHYLEEGAKNLPGATQYAAIHQQTRALAHRLKMGFTYYGHPGTYAPRASYDFYNKSIDKAVDGLTDLENDCLAYQAALDKRKDAAAELTKTESNARAHITALAAQRGEAEKRIASIESAVRAAHDKVIEQEKVVSTAIQKVQDEIYEAEGITFTNFITMLSSLTPPKDTEPLSIIKAVGNGVIEVKNFLDDSKTQYKVNRIGQLRDGMKPFKAAFEESNGYLTLDDPNGYKLMASKKAVEAQLKKYEGKITDAARDALNRLLDLSEQLNQLVMDYNGVRGEIADIDAQSKAAQDQLAQASAALAKNSQPDLPEFSAWVGDLYEKARNSVVEQLYLASKAYGWWALKSYPIYARLGISSASTVTAGVLKAAKGQLLNDLRIVVEGRGSAPSRFPPNPKGTGAVVKIDGANFRRAFAELKEGRPTTIFLPPSRPHTTPVPLLPPAESGNMKAFALLAEVMVKKVRVYLRGAKTSDRQFAISITHGGVHEVVRRDSEEFVFTSVPVHLLFKYEENIDGTTKINFDGNIAESGDESRYAPLSPFGWWRISIDRITNSGLDLSGLMSVDLEFHGDAYSFPSYSSSQK